MPPRAIILAALLLPGVADAQFSLTATAVGRGGQPDGMPHVGSCAKDTCRVILPVRVAGDVCVLNVEVTTPVREGWGKVLFGAGPCKSGLKLSIPLDASTQGYALDHYYAASAAYTVPFQSGASMGQNKLVDDGVVHAGASVRLDIIGSPSPR